MQKAWWESVGDREVKAWCSLFHSGNSPRTEGHHQEVSWGKLLEVVQNRDNKQSNNPVSEPAPCPTSFYHWRHIPLQDLCLGRLQGFPKQAVRFLHSYLPTHWFLSSWRHNPSQLLRQHGPGACTDFWNRKYSMKLSGWRLQINVSLFSCRELIQCCSLPRAAVETWGIKRDSARNLINWGRINPLGAQCSSWSHSDLSSFWLRKSGLFVNLAIGTMPNPGSWDGMPQGALLCTQMTPGLRSETSHYPNRDKFEDFFFGRSQHGFIQ